MKRAIKMKGTLSSDKWDNGQIEWTYWIDDKEVSALEYYNLEHIKDYDIAQLSQEYDKIMDEEPADSHQVQHWNNKLSLVENMINDKRGINIINIKF